MVEKEPENVSTWVNLAKLQLSTGDKTAALQSFERAQALKPEDSELTRVIHSLRSGQ
jgi:cytochrome c-type biogenesis protein CcmH/NrfG